MRSITESLSISDVSSALGLVTGGYEKERAGNPFLPAQMMGSDDEVASLIAQSVPNGAVKLVEKVRMTGFMGISALFRFKGQQAASIGVVSHAACEDNKERTYQALYGALGEHLKKHQARIHIIAHFAGDVALKDTLFRLGFGAFLAERIRDLSPIPGASHVETDQVVDFAEILDLETEHMGYYQKAPIYLKKDDSSEAALASLTRRQASGAVLFVYRENRKPLAYFIAGLCTGSQDGRILRNTNTAQVLSAYASPCARGRGIGKALLSRTIGWAREQGFARLFVEHETANACGENFWRKHFNPYLYFSMRYVEDWN